jgi:hypothetical protein
MLLDRVRPVFDHPGPYLTIHAEVGRDAQDALDQLDARWTSIRHQLEDHGYGGDLVDELERRFKENPRVSGEARRPLVAAGDQVVLDELQPGHALWSETCDVAELPDLKGWVRGAEAELPFLLVQTDRTGADLDYYRAVSAPAVDQKSVEGDTFYITKVPQGDWAQSQFQQTAEETWKRNAGEVAEVVRSVVRERRPRAVLVAGDVRAVQELLDHLEGVQVPVVKLESGGRAEGTSEEALQGELQRVLAEFAARDEQDVRESLEAAAGRDRGEAAHGLDEVLDALVKGQVERLVIDPDKAAESVVRPGDHQGLPLPGTVDKAELPADRVLLAAAVMSDAEVTVIPAEQSPAGEVSALLRWSDQVSGEQQAERQAEQEDSAE